MSIAIETLNNKITAIADAIREKTGNTDVMTMDEMVIAIQNLSGKPDPTSYTAMLCDLFGVDSSEYPYVIVKLYARTGDSKTVIYFTKSVTWSGNNLDLDYYYKGYQASKTLKTEPRVMHTIGEVYDYITVNYDSFVAEETRPTLDLSMTANDYGYAEYYANFDNGVTVNANTLYYLKFE